MNEFRTTDILPTPLPRALVIIFRCSTLVHTDFPDFSLCLGEQRMLRLVSCEIKRIRVQYMAKSGYGY